VNPAGTMKKRLTKSQELENSLGHKQSFQPRIQKSEQSDN